MFILEHEAILSNLVWCANDKGSLAYARFGASKVFIYYLLAALKHSIARNLTRKLKNG